MDSLWKRQQVSLYLEQLYGEEPVPEFELNDQTISHLYDLAMLSQKNEKNTKLLVDDLQQKSEEYNALSKRLSTTLDNLGLGAQHLSKSGANSLTTLGKLGDTLHVNNACETSYYLALQDLDDEQYRVDQQLADCEKKLKQLTDKSQKADFKVESLQKALNLVQQSTAEEFKLAETKMKDVTPYYKKKAKSYQKDIGKLQTAQKNLNSVVGHEELTKKSQRLSKLKAELEPLKRELQSYLVLPPNLSETKILIEKKKKELSDLDKELAQCVNSSVLS